MSAPKSNTTACDLCGDIEGGPCGDKECPRRSWPETTLSSPATDNYGVTICRHCDPVRPENVGAEVDDICPQCGATMFGLESTAASVRIYYGRYKAVVRIRRGAYWTVKPEALQLDGRVCTFRAGWRITDDDSSIYAGEWAMIPEETGWPVAWIASGDLTNLQEQP